MTGGTASRTSASSWTKRLMGQFNQSINQWVCIYNAHLKNAEHNQRENLSTWYLFPMSEKLFVKRWYRILDELDGLTLRSSSPISSLNSLRLLWRNRAGGWERVARSPAFLQANAAIFGCSDATVVFTSARQKQAFLSLYKSWLSALSPQVAVRLLSHKIQSPQEKEALQALTVRNRLSFFVCLTYTVIMYPERDDCRETLSSRCDQSV